MTKNFPTFKSRRILKIDRQTDRQTKPWFDQPISKLSQQGCKTRNNQIKTRSTFLKIDNATSQSERFHNQP